MFNYFSRFNSVTSAFLPKFHVKFWFLLFVHLDTSEYEGNYYQPVFWSRRDVKNVTFQRILEKAAITAGQAYALGQGLG